LARAKNTSRAQSRRRHREEQRQNQLSDEASANQLSDGDDDAQSVTPNPGIRAMFKMPDWRKDIRDLPVILRTSKKVWVAFVALFVSFVMAVALDRGYVPVGPDKIAALFVELTLPPTALFIFFIGGFLAPRASYLVGALLGLVDGILWSALFLISPTAQADATARPVKPVDFVLVILVAIVVGTLAAGFAAWYRNFLRQSQERARQNRLAREQQAKIKAKDDARKERDAARQASAAARQAPKTSSK
jgi:hypothetical protein